MRLSVKLMKNAFYVAGLYPLSETKIIHKFHGHICTVSLIFLLTSISIQAIFYTEGFARLLPFTYAVCSIHALNKRFSMFYHKDSITQFLTLIDNPYVYSDKEYMKDVEFSQKTLLLIYQVVTSLLIQLFFSAYVSPFFRVVIGGTLDYDVIMYPMYVPWEVKTLPVYILTYIVQAILVSPALMLIYSTTIYIVFSMILFKFEFDKICEAVKTLESRTDFKVAKINYKQVHNTFSQNETITEAELTRRYNLTYHSSLRECIMHYQHLVRTFKAFSTWYNLFFTAELLESTSTICLLFFCTLKMNDLSIFLNILSICFHVVVSLFFRCYTGEFFMEMNERLKFYLYDVGWYHKPKEIMTSFHIFHMHLKKPLTLHGFKHFPSSYKTFSGVVRTSYSYCNFLIASLKQKIPNQHAWVTHVINLK